MAKPLSFGIIQINEMEAKRVRQRRLVNRGTCHVSEMATILEDTKRGVCRKSFLAKHDREWRSQASLITLMVFSLMVQLAVLRHGLHPQYHRTQWPPDIVGDADKEKNIRMLSGLDDDPPSADIVVSNVKGEHTKNPVTTLPSAGAIKSNLRSREGRTETERSVSHDVDNIKSNGILKQGHPKDSARSISRIDKDYPSADTIKSILKEEEHNLPANNGGATAEDMANTYELVYAFIAAFQREDIPIFLGYGSHLGARRHHGIIPFLEKDIDLQVFSVNENKVKSIVRGVLKTKEAWSSIFVENDEYGLGFQLKKESMVQHGFKHYIEFWLFGSNVGKGNKVSCIGRKLHSKRYKRNTGCQIFYMHYAGRYPPQFQHSDYFPPLYQVFGSHKVPIPRTSRELETFDYNIAEEHWNTTCGSHRYYDKETGEWVNVPKEERECSKLYDTYPFVFKTGNGAEELRQGDIVIHRSVLES